jgi:hypothetical protein
VGEDPLEPVVGKFDGRRSGSCGGHCRDVLLPVEGVSLVREDQIRALGSLPNYPHARDVVLGSLAGQRAEIAVTLGDGSLASIPPTAVLVESSTLGGATAHLRPPNVSHRLRGECFRL